MRLPLSPTLTFNPSSVSSPIRIHLHHKTASSFRSGDTLGGTAYFPPSEATRPAISTKVELRGFVESTARVAHKRRLDKLKESVEAHIPTGAMENLAIERRANNLTEKMQAAEDPSQHDHRKVFRELNILGEAAESWVHCR